MMKTAVRGTIKLERIAGTKLVRTIAPFPFFSMILGRWSEIPAGFIYDEESIPVLRGTNPEGGAIHDYLCRCDSDPVVDKLTAAKVYEEFQEYYNALNDRNKKTSWRDYIAAMIDRVMDFIKPKIKTSVVIAAPGYFHKLPVMATLEQVQKELG
jgi:hypothetical protein